LRQTKSTSDYVADSSHKVLRHFAVTATERRRRLKRKSSPRQEEIKCSAKSFAVHTGIVCALLDRHLPRPPFSKKPIMMIPVPLPSQVIHRHPDGAIDFDYYRARATLLRRKATRRILKRSGAPLALISIAVVARLMMAAPMHQLRGHAAGLSNISAPAIRSLPGQDHGRSCPRERRRDA